MENLKGTTKVWLTDISRFSTRDLKDSIDEGFPEYAINALQYTNSDMSRCDGWMEVGTASVDITFHHEETMVEQLAEGLRNQITIVRAEAQSKVAQLEDKLNQLLALPSPNQGEPA